jgi:peptidylprolyl isomerase
MIRRSLAILPVLVIALAGMAVACGDGPDPAPTPVATAAKQATAASTAASKGPIKLENATVLPDGLQYTDQVVGTGASPRMDQQVTVHYTGKLAANGQVFDSSVQRGQPATFPMGGVIKGFSEGLSTMKVGGKRTVFIPSALGYGAAGTPGGPIPPNADLIFELELIAVK